MRKGRRRWAVIAILLAVGLSIVLAVFGRNLWWVLNGSNPADLITVSKETTYLTEPLDARGFVDYLEAINQRHAAGVTPENNFEIVVRSLYGDASMEANFGREYFRRLEIYGPGAGSTSFVPLTRYLDSQPAPEGQDKAAWRDRLWSVMEQPWTAEDFPEVHSWLTAADGFLDFAVEGSFRPADYTPYIAPDGWCMMTLLPSTSDRRDLTRGLMTRCLFRIGAGDADGAWQDLQAIRRVARHTASGAFIIEGLVGVAIETMACEGTTHLLQNVELSADQLASIAADLDAIPPLPSSMEKLSEFERYVYLDSCRRYLQTGSRWDEKAPRTSMKHVLFLDWNAVMRRANANYEQFVVAARIEDPSERMQQVNVIAGRLEAEAEQAKQQELVTSAESFAAILFDEFMPAFAMQLIAEDRAAIRLELSRLAVALERHRLDRGEYPETLDALVPTYAKRIPSDPFSGKPLVYSRQPEGYVLYSIGPNNKDDGGVESDENPRERDDVAVRIARGAE